MRIGIDARLTYYRQGGIANYMRRVIAALAGLDDDTAYFPLHSRKETPREVRTLAPGENFRPAAVITPCHHRLERWALGLEITRLRLDLLHSPDFIPPLWGARRHVITVHDLNFLHYPQFLTAESRRYYNGQIAYAVRAADHILADSAATKADLVQMLAVPAEKITVHMLGVDPEFQPLPAEVVTAVRHELNLPQAFILFVGTFEPRKNIGGLLAAYAQLRASLPDLPPLVLAGRRGWLFEDTFARIAELGLTGCVLWREDVPQARLPALYNAASALALPSLYEGFGLTALEALACGTPAVVTNRSSVPEVVGDAGVLVNPDDPASIAEGLRCALTDSALRERLRAAGFARARTFTWEHTAQTVYEVYHRVLW